MLYIYICEDEVNQLNFIKESIQKSIFINNLDMEIAVASSNPHDILQTIPSDGQMGIYFLDITLNSDLDGFSLAKEIRKVDPRGFIVFITSHSEMAHLTFHLKLEVLDYIVKDRLESLSSQINDCLFNIMEKCSSVREQRLKKFIFRIGDRMSFVNLNDILYFETHVQSHKLILHSVHSEIQFNGTLKGISAQLDSRFYQCHRSYIVNIDFIRDVDFSKKTITMSDGKQILLSLRKKHDFFQFIHLYDSNVKDL